MEVLSAKLFDLGGGKYLHISAEENIDTGICALGIEIKDIYGGDNTIAAVDVSRNDSKLFINIYGSDEKPQFRKEMRVSGS